MTFAIFGVLGGCLLLVLGANYLVDGASSLARRLGIPTLVIGLTVVAFGTSAPELAVNVTSALNGSTDIAIGNINGSNIANILLILGVTALISPIAIKRRTTAREIPLALLAAALVVVAASDVLLGEGTQNVITRTEGIFLLGIFFIFLHYLFLSAKNDKEPHAEKPKYKLAPAIGFSVVGLIALVFGGRLAVGGAVEIAEMLGVSQTFIAVTIIALGTSLPELVSSIIAARKGEVDLAIGNVVGSNIFNILLVLSATAIIQPIYVNAFAYTDAIIVVLVTLLLMTLIFLRKENTPGEREINRTEGILFLLAYAVYILYIVLRG